MCDFINWNSAFPFLPKSRVPILGPDLGSRSRIPLLKRKNIISGLHVMNYDLIKIFQALREGDT